MRSSLFDYEWQFLTQMIPRIHYTASYEELCRLLLELSLIHISEPTRPY